VKILVQFDIRHFFFRPHNKKIMLLIMVCVIVIMVVDVSLARVYDLIAKQPTSHWRIAIFAVITSICIFGNYLVLVYTQNRSTDTRRVAKLRIGSIYQVVRISQLIITVVLVILILQTVINLRYSTWLILVILWISYGLAITMLGLLAKRFFSWGLSDKNPTIILYALASASLSVGAGFSLVYVSDILVDKPEEIMPFSAGSMVSIVPDSGRAILNSGFFVSSVVSFALLWGATVVLLHHYSTKLGAIRYWMIVSAPLVLFLGQFVGFFARLFDPLLASDPVTFAIWITLIFTLSKPMGGVLFGIAFYTIARNFRQNPVLRNYLIISTLGFVLLYVADHASVLLVAPFPPFGIPSVSFMGLASYLILLGIHSSVISISEDANLRRSLRKTAIDQSQLLDSMASAHIMEEIHKKAVRIMKDSAARVAKITGVEPSDSEEDWKQYVDEVMTEMSKNRKRKTKAKDPSSELGDENSPREDL
jgi:hypothetical protein